MSIGAPDAYGEGSDAIAAQRVSNAGGSPSLFYTARPENGTFFFEVYVVSAIGNDGADGLQTVASPATSSGAIAVAAVDNSYTAQLYLTTPDGENIIYLPGVKFGGWRSIVPATIVVNGS